MAKTDKTKSEKAELDRLYQHVFQMIPSEHVGSAADHTSGPFAPYKKACAAVDVLYRKLMSQVEKHPTLNALRKKREALLAEGRKEVKARRAEMYKLKTNLLAGRDLDKVRAELLKIADALSGE